MFIKFPVLFLVVVLSQQFVEGSPATNGGPIIVTADRTVICRCEKQCTDPQFDIDAVESLSEAYELYPDTDSIMEKFGELFKLKHSGDWDVGAGCTTLALYKVNVLIQISVTNSPTEKLTVYLF
ncbi:hypothetical protein NQ317_003725 [Molorchus minor]|uniref:Uncharacterized protein n=1 Tax=Molorchus minor TaxID=1323400 RepID=A0ABQ9IUR7_9CUCU|nr:hypothetical protein NQ317_003725 [Molorchus minor]